MATLDPFEPEGDLEIDAETFKDWLFLPTTRAFRRRLIMAFDHQTALEGAPPGTAVDRYLGRAEVLAFIYEPHKLFEE